MCIQRILGREVYNQQEKLAWSIVLATKGLNGLIDELLNSEEYISNFGFHTVPYQRRRILPQHTFGDQPFARMARYDSYYRNSQPRGQIYRFDSVVQPSNLTKFLRDVDWKAVVGVLMIFASVAIITLVIGYGFNPA